RLGNAALIPELRWPWQLSPLSGEGRALFQDADRAGCDGASRAAAKPPTRCGRHFAGQEMNRRDLIESVRASMCSIRGDGRTIVVFVRRTQICEICSR